MSTLSAITKQPMSTLSVSYNKAIYVHTVVSYNLPWGTRVKNSSCNLQHYNSVWVWWVADRGSSFLCNTGTHPSDYNSSPHRSACGHNGTHQGLFWGCADEMQSHSTFHLSNNNFIYKSMFFVWLYSSFNHKIHSFVYYVVSIFWFFHTYTRTYAHMRAHTNTHTHTQRAKLIACHSLRNCQMCPKA